MVKAIRVYELGGPEVLKWEDVEVGDPKEGEIRVKNKAIGVNFTDVYYRKGVYKTTLPFTPGFEAVGVVTAVGPGLTGREVGDVVAFASNLLGSYTEEQILPASVVVPVPSSIEPTVAASIMLKGMTAQCLVRRCFKVLKWEDVEVGDPKEAEIRVKNKAIGLNFIDVYYRKGVYRTALPYTPGAEAVGIVTAMGPGLTGREVGDVVAYAGRPLGSYTEEQILPARVVVPVPSSIAPTVAASIMVKGMTAQFLVRRCFKVESGHTVLVHAAAGGVGSLLCQWAKALNATVIGTVSTEAKAAQATEDGCDHVIIYKHEDFVARINEITSGKGVDVVYDSVGRDTLQGSLACLKTRGHMVSFGQSSGTPDPVPLSALASKSLSLTWPTLAHFNTTRDELFESAGEVFANVAAGVLKVRLNHTYLLSDAARAHDDLENRRTTGSVVLIPDANHHEKNI